MSAEKESFEKILSEKLRQSSLFDEKTFDGLSINDQISSVLERYWDYFTKTDLIECIQKEIISEYNFREKELIKVSADDYFQQDIKPLAQSLDELDRVICDLKKNITALRNCVFSSYQDRWRKLSNLAEHAGFDCNCQSSSSLSFEKFDLFFKEGKELFKEFFSEYESFECYSKPLFLTITDLTNQLVSVEERKKQLLQLNAPLVQLTEKYRRRRHLLSDDLFVQQVIHPELGTVQLFRPRLKEEIEAVILQQLPSIKKLLEYKELFELANRHAPYDSSMRCFEKCDGRFLWRLTGSLAESLNHCYCFHIRSFRKPSGLTMMRFIRFLWHYHVMGGHQWFPNKLRYQ